MSLSSTVSLGALRLQAQQRADLENSPNISTAEWNQYISQSYKELYDLLVSAYGNDYFMAAPYALTLTGAQYYALPSDFYKLVGVDLQYSGSPTGWVTLRRFEEIERNKFAYPNTQSNYSGYTNLRYRISGGNLWFIPIPTASQTAQVLYIPEPTALSFIPTCATTLSSAVVTVSDVTDLSVGMSVAGNGIAASVTVTAVNAGLSQVTLSSLVAFTQPIVPLQFWTDAATMDGIAGWEEYLIIDAAIKAQIKEECDVTELRIQKADMKARIESMAEGRDSGQAHHVSDVLGANGFGYDDMGGGW